ncbi:MAG: ATP-dependent 6-phosphofructokinase [Anaerolineae bacterium]|jgi:6-phosphofructokinase 1
MADKVRRIAVVTAGEDCPGYNPCIRAVVRMALHLGWEPWGVRRGFAGLVKGELAPLGNRQMSGIIGRGGTILGTTPACGLTDAGERRDSLRALNMEGIGALVVIGGREAMQGALGLQEADIAVIGVPATVENELLGTDRAIGVDTALNTILGSIDHLKDTASSRQLAFLVEVCGRESGYLALQAGIAGGAEMVCLPEQAFELDDVAREVSDSYVRGKEHCIIVVAEGADPNAAAIYEHLGAQRERTGFDVRLSLLGEIQRGGPPSAQDRHLATRLGSEAVRRLAEGDSGGMVGMVDGALRYTPLADVVAARRELPEKELATAGMLAR